MSHMIINVWTCIYTTASDMIQRQCFFLFLCSTVIFGALLWNSIPLALIVIDNSQTKENVHHTNSSREIESIATYHHHSHHHHHHQINEEQHLHPIDNVTAAKMREEVQNLMKPWQTIQIFPPKMDPRRMKFPTKLKDIKKQKKSRKTHGIESRIKSCAVVGNSGILLGSNCGHIIDNMDLIIRMNLAEFGHKHSSDVGSKISFMTINRVQFQQVLFCFLNMTKEGKEVPLHNETDIPRVCKILVKRLRMLNDGVLWLFKHRIPGAIRALHFFMKKFSINLQFAYSPLTPISPPKRLWKFHFPSTGLAMYTASTQLCDEISLFGFYPFYTDPHNRTIPHHYYEPEITLNYTENSHGIPKEHEFLINLEKNGAIRLVNNCTQIVNNVSILQP